MLMMLHADGPSRCWIDSWLLHHVNVKPESARETTLSTSSEVPQLSAELVVISIQ